MYDNFIEINMIEDRLQNQLFKNVKTVEDFYLQVSMLAGSQMKEKENTLIFIDEIQAYPHLLTLLRFLSQDDKFTYIASGSLLDVTLSNTSSIPMGSIRKIRMCPLDFEEFIRVLGLNDLTLSILENKFNHLETLDETMHDKMMDLFRKYLLVGGLPDVINTYLETKNIQAVREVQNEIYEYYKFIFYRIIYVFQNTGSESGLGKRKYAICHVLFSHDWSCHRSSHVSGRLAAG